MSTSPQNDFHCTKLFRLSYTPITNTPSKVPILVAFGTCKTPCAEIWKFVTGLCLCTPIHFCYFKSGQNRCRISGRNCDRKKHVLASLGGTPAAISPIFCISAHRDPSLIFQLSSRSVQVWGDITEKPVYDPQSKCNTRLFEPVTTAVLWSRYSAQKVLNFRRCALRHAESLGINCR